MLYEVAFFDCDIFHMRICRANTIWMIDAHIERPADLTGKADMACSSRHHQRIRLSFIFPTPITRSTDVRWRTKPINHPSRDRRYITFAPPAAVAKIACKIAVI